MNKDKGLKDKIWRLQNLYRIKDKNKKIIKMKFNKVQQMILEDIINQKPIRHFSLKYRQPGISTFWLLWWLDDTIFHSNTTTGLLSHKWESLNYLWDIVMLAFKFLPDRIKPHLKESSRRALEFDQINSKIFISLSIRSIGLHNLHISEWCFCDDEEVRATMGACSPMTNISGESTGNGVANDGYLTYQDAKVGESEFLCRFFPWFFQEEYKLPLNDMSSSYIMNNLSSEEIKLQKLMKKEYNMKLLPEQVLFRRQKKKALKDIFPQEYPETDEDAFITSGQHYFNVKKILVLLNEARDYYKEEKYYEKTEEYVCFEPPNRKDIFVAGADTAEGLQDFSVLKIINVSQRREAFVFRARCGVKKFYKICDEWCRIYNNALLAVESNNTGHAVLLGLSEDCNYSNLYQEINTRSKGEIKKKLGWNTNKISRVTMLTDLKYGIEEDDDIDENNFVPKFMVYDMNFLKEALTFIKIDDKYEAEHGKTDDDIFATAIAFQIFLKSKPFYHSDFGVNIIAETNAYSL